jgi:limonene-1,2-epoxide hydrolase
MSTADTLAVVRAYHRAWTNGDYAEAGRRLARRLRIEVPINEYRGREDFLAAVKAFAAVVESVGLLFECADNDQAVLLYDLEVGPIGPLRVCEHFTVADGLITQIRQVHDTAALRDAGFVQ